MSLLDVILGPCPCHTCGAQVMWVRTFTGLELRSVAYDTMGRRLADLHTCRPRLWPRVAPTPFPRPVVRDTTTAKEIAL